MEPEERQKVVCVTGAGGYLAWWLVKTLLSKGYFVHGTVRDPDDKKNEQLKNLDNSSGRLKLFKADLLDYNELYSAIVGCDGVHHVASPVPLGVVSDPEKELIDPAVKGTLNVLKASSEAGVKRVIFVSSSAAILMSPSSPENDFYDENFWSDMEHCRTTNNWYFLSKTMAEKHAWEYAKESGLDLVTVCPTLNLGPMLQPTVNTSCLLLLRLLNGEKETLEYIDHGIVDVRDVSEALVLVYENSEASGRYICNGYNVRMHDLVEILKPIYPDYNYPKQIIDVAQVKHVSSNKLQSLGWSFRPLEETLTDTVRCFRERGLLG